MFFRRHTFAYVHRRHDLSLFFPAVPRSSHASSLRENDEHIDQFAALWAF